MNLTAIIHTRNSAATLPRALESVRWAGEVLVVDMESEDGTAALAAAHGARVIAIPRAPRVDGVRNAAAAEASHPWVLVLDSDEYLADDAGDAVARLVQAQGTAHDAFAVPRFNYVGGQLLRGGSWYPDFQIRLFRRGTVAWSDTHHQPPRVVTGPHRLLHLEPPGCLHIHHAHHATLLDMARRQLEYAATSAYDADPERFAFADYVAEAYAALAERRDPDADGDLSHALALLLAWDAVVRGLTHWERLDPRPPLGALAALPVAARTLPAARARTRRWLDRYDLRPLARRARRRLLRTLRWPGPGR
ncbi:MAG: glycosyltransferase [Vicinamibacterales bacterium]